MVMFMAQQRSQPKSKVTQCLKISYKRPCLLKVAFERILLDVAFTLARFLLSLFALVRG